MLDNKTARKLVTKTASNFNTVYLQELKDRFKKESEKVKERLLNDYRDILVSVPTHQKSKLKPVDLESYYIDFIEDFDYFEEGNSDPYFSVPTVEDLFDSGVDELKVMGTMVEGLVGSYYELNKEEYDEYDFKKTNILMFVVKNEPVYLVASRFIPPDIKKVMRTKNILKKWPFRVGIERDIFINTIEYKNRNIGSWLKQSALESTYRLEFAAK